MKITRLVTLAAVALGASLAFGCASAEKGNMAPEEQVRPSDPKPAEPKPMPEPKPKPTPGPKDTGDPPPESAPVN